MFKNFIFIIFYLFIFGKNLNSKPLIDSDWVAKNSCEKNIKVIEVGSSSKAFITQHIPCAVYTDFYKDNWRIKKADKMIDLRMR